MKPIRTYQLISLLVDYDFYNWDDENVKTYEMVFGIPEEKLSFIGFPQFYNSWGYDAVNNENANPMFTPYEWNNLEHTFFEWLKNAEHVLFPSGKVFVTPSLYRDWLIEQYLYPEWESQHIWFKDDCQKYQDLLVQSGVINREPDFIVYRGALIESFGEVEILGKISIKGVPLLFFSDKKMVIEITDYLSVKITFKDEQTLNQIKGIVDELLTPQYFL